MNIKLNGSKGVIFGLASLSCCYWRIHSSFLGETTRFYMRWWIASQWSLFGPQHLLSGLERSSSKTRLWLRDVFVDRWIEMDALKPLDDNWAMTRSFQTRYCVGGKCLGGTRKPYHARPPKKPSQESYESIPLRLSGWFDGQSKVTGIDEALYETLLPVGHRCGMCHCKGLVL